MNNVVLIGRLTRDPEVRYAASTQMAVARFSLAVDRGGRDKGADFINCVAFGKTAELMEKYTAKGLRLAVQGHIQTGSYDKQDGTKVYTTEVVADRVEFIEWGGDRPAGGTSHQSTSYSRPVADNNNMVEEMPDSFQAIDEDVPF